VEAGVLISPFENLLKFTQLQLFDFFRRERFQNRIPINLFNIHDHSSMLGAGIFFLEPISKIVDHAQGFACGGLVRLRRIKFIFEIGSS
jgi:hypothetical protein